MWLEDIILAQGCPRETFDCDQQAVLNLLSGVSCSKVMFSNALPLESSQVWPLALLSIYQMLCSEILWLSGLPPVMEHSLSIQSRAAHWHKLQGESGSSGIYLLSAWKNSMCLFLDGTGSHLFSALVLVKIIWLLFLVLIISQWSNCCFFDALWETL